MASQTELGQDTWYLSLPRSIIEEKSHPGIGCTLEIERKEGFMPTCLQYKGMRRTIIRHEDHNNKPGGTSHRAQRVLAERATREECYQPYLFASEDAGTPVRCRLAGKADVEANALHVNAFRPTEESSDGDSKRTT